MYKHKLIHSVYKLKNELLSINVCEPSGLKQIRFHCKKHAGTSTHQRSFALASSFKMKQYTGNLISNSLHLCTCNLNIQSSPFLCTNCIIYL